MRLKNTKRCESYNPDDLKVLVLYTLGLLEKAFPGGTADYNKDDPEDFYYQDKTFVNVQGDFVNIKYIEATCSLSDSYDGPCFRFVGSERPDPEELLDPYNKDEVITYPSDKHLFEKFVCVGGKDINEAQLEIRQTVAEFSSYHKETINLWKDMQESIKRQDGLREEMERIQADFQKKLG